MGGGGKGGAARAAASTILARSSSRNSLKSILPLPVLSTLMIIRFTCARQERTVRPAVAPGAAGGRHLLFPRLKAERAQHNLQRVRVYHACARASMQRVVAVLRGVAQWNRDAPCPSLSKRSNACLISVRWSSVSVSSVVVFLAFGAMHALSHNVAFLLAWVKPSPITAQRGRTLNASPSADTSSSPSSPASS